MVAVVQAPPAPVRRLALAPTGLRAVGLAPAPRPAVAAVYRRRRAAAAAVLMILGLVTVLSVRALFAPSAIGRAPTPASASASAHPATTGSVHVVQPGDTFWDIARALRPGEDPRPLVARLVAAHGSPDLVVGERIRVPAGA